MDRRKFRSILVTMADDHYRVTEVQTLASHATARAAAKWINRYLWGPNPHPADCWRVAVIDSEGYLVSGDGKTRCLDRPVEIGKQMPGTVVMDECIHD